jgi:hypothetical protein
MGGSLISVPTHLVARSILAHLLVENSCNRCFQFSKPIYESEEHDVMLLQLNTPFVVGLTQSSSHTVVMYKWFISSISKQVGSTNLSPCEGSSEITLYSPNSNVIFLVFMFIMA